MMQKITFSQEGSWGVCVQEGRGRLQFHPGDTFEVLSSQDGRLDTVVLELKHPEGKTYLGGPDGKTELPCTIRATVLKAAFKVVR